MLDEAQLVAATSSVAAQMTSSLWRRHAWVVTGTPITTRLDEIQVSPFFNSKAWCWLANQPTCLSTLPITAAFSLCQGTTHSAPCWDMHGSLHSAQVSTS